VTLLPDVEIERRIVTAFVVAQKRARYSALLESRKGRDKFRRSLAHFSDWDARFVLRIDDHTPQAIHKRLLSMGTPPICYITSENDRNDAKRLDLLEALTACVGYGVGTVISCIPGRLAFYEGEGPGERHLLAREKPA
jgi:hypothetical protein